jgi:hypothetical protein
MPGDDEVSVELREIPPGRLRLTKGGQTLFEVETRRIFEASSRLADAGRSWLWLGGCFKPYHFEHVSGTYVAVGPLTHEHVAELVKRLTDRLTLPVSPVAIPFEELQQTPDAFHGMFLETEGEWQLAPDVSAFGKVWLTEPNGFVRPIRFGKLRVRASGIWHALPRAKVGSVGPPGGYGHMGMWPGEFEAYAITVLGSSAERFFVRRLHEHEG